MRKAYLHMINVHISTTMLIYINQDKMSDADYEYYSGAAFMAATLAKETAKYSQVIS